MFESVLISEFRFALQRVDKTATNLPPPGSPFASGYDYDFSRPHSLDGGLVPDSALIYEPEEELKGQVEEFSTQRQLRQGVGGNDVPGRVELIFLRADLDAIGWVDAAGEVLLGPDDRLVRATEIETGKIAWEAVSAFGDYLYVVHARHDGQGGLNASARSGLIDVFFETRSRTR